VILEDYGKSFLILTFELIMNLDQNDIEIVHNMPDNRFEVILEEKKAILIYMIRKSLFIIIHTEVPPPYEGQRIAANLNRAALNYAKKEGYKVRSYCSYTTMYIERNLEYAALLG